VQKSRRIPDDKLEETWTKVLVLSRYLIEEEAQESYENRSADGYSNTKLPAQQD
jgi:hypothetical protein